MDISEIFYNVGYLEYFGTIVFLFGICVGSFLNVCIWRIPIKESIIFTPSHCPKCGKKIYFYENIPIISWIILLGRCSKCKASISARYPIVELLTGALFAYTFIEMGSNGYPMPAIIATWVGIVLFITTFFIDIKHKIIPNKITYSVIIFSVVMSVIFPSYVQESSRYLGLLNSISGLVIGGGILSVIAIFGKIIFKKQVIGQGDVKFLAAVGACFGLFPVAWFFVLFIGSLLGFIIGIISILFNRKKMSSTIPFGPFLAIAGVIWVVYGKELIAYYLKFILTYL